MNKIEGDLLKLAKEGKFDIIAHGCNCKGLMGAGIAAQVAKEFPMAKFADLKYKEMMKNHFGEHHEAAMLGTFSMAVHNKVIILNMYTQIETGANFDLQRGLYPALVKANLMFTQPYPKEPLSIGFPQIGAGIGGGDWSDIQRYIESAMRDVVPTIVLYPPKPKGPPTVKEQILAKSK